VGIVPGGATRAASVQAALDALDDVDVVLVHDAARPLVTTAIVERCIVAASAGDGAVVGWPASDTLKVVDGERAVQSTPDRTRIWHAQTPQGFPREPLEGAHAAWAGREGTADGA